MQFNSFLFLSRPTAVQVDGELILPSLFPFQSMMLNAKLGFYVLDEASKESKLIAEYHIIEKKSDVKSGS